MTLPLATTLDRLAGRAGRAFPKGDVRLAIVVLLGAAIAGAGGTSRYDSPTQSVVRLAAIAALAASLWPLDLAPLARHARLLVGIALAWLLISLQLVPMPPAWWAALPGHDLYAGIAETAGAVGWRPLSLVPDLTVNALFALLPGTAVVIAALFLDMRGRMRLALALAALATASAVLGLMQLAAGGLALHLYSASDPDAPVGLFANPNHHAAFLAALLPAVGASAGLRLRGGARPRLVLGVALGAALLMLLALMLTGSRMGVLLAAIGAGGGIAAFRASGARLPGRGRRRRLAMLAITLGLAVAVGGAAIAGGAIGRFAATDWLSEIRLLTLTPLARTAAAYMPVGAGFGTFDPVYRRFEPDALLSTIYLNQAHDEPMQLAIEGGVPALALLALFLLWWARTAWRIVRWRAQASRRRALAVAALTATSVLMVSSLVDYPLRTPLAAMVFALACVEMARGAAAADDRQPPQMIISQQP
ncbi:MAG TPA: O-antigen ligase family protein [Sphingomonas sp.]|nr:O-antigen ligase family protein [Sphingomonas sp.]